MTRILLVVAAAALFVVWLFMRREMRRVGEQLRNSEARRAARMRERRGSGTSEASATGVETLERDPKTGVYRPRADQDDPSR